MSLQLRIGFCSQCIVHPQGQACVLVKNTSHSCRRLCTHRSLPTCTVYRQLCTHRSLPTCTTSIGSFAHIDLYPRVHTRTSALIFTHMYTLLTYLMYTSMWAVVGYRSSNGHQTRQVALQNIGRICPSMLLSIYREPWKHSTVEQRPSSNGLIRKGMQISYRTGKVPGGTL